MRSDSMLLLGPVLLILPIFILLMTTSARANSDLGPFKLQFGDLEIVALSDSTGSFPYDYFNGITREKFQNYAKKNDPATVDTLPSWVNAFLVKKDGQLILVDTGYGALSGKGQLAESLKVAGINPDQIDLVLLTHYHGDHIGGLIYEGRPFFPKATIMAAFEEELYWLGTPEGAEKNTLQNESLAPYKALGQFKTFKAGKILDGLEAVSLFGHTPGHTGFLFKSGKYSFLAWGDVVHSAIIQFGEPKVTLKFDVSQPEAAQTRLAIFDRAIKEDLLVGGAHLPFPGLGRVLPSGESYEFSLVEKSDLPQPIAVGVKK